MVKTALIAPIGTSAPVITEIVQYVHGMEGLYLTDVVILPTQDEYVKAHTSLATAAINSRYPKIRTHIRSLPFEDINSTEDNVEFMKLAAGVIKEERSEHKCEKVYLSIAGGRKDICASLAIVGQLVGADGVFHIIHPSVSNLNIKIERIKKEILELHYAPPEKRAEIYEKYRDYFDDIMFPSLSGVNYIQIPSIPYPQEYLGKLAEILLSDYVDLDNSGISMPDIKRLERAGFIKVAKDRLVPTDFGSLVGSIWT